MNLKSVSVWMVFGLFMALPLMGVVSAQANSGDSWGFEMNVDLGKEFKSYLDVGTDSAVLYLNTMLSQRDERYSVDSHYDNIDGSLKVAGAFEKNGNSVNFEVGEYADMDLKLGMNGTFPVAQTLGDFLNDPDNVSAGNVHYSMEIITREKMISSGTCIMEDNSIKSMNANTSYELSLRFIGNSVPMSALIYSLARVEATSFEGGDIEISFIYDSSSSTNGSLVFHVVGYSNLKPSGLSIDDSNLTLNYMDINGDNRIDTGDEVVITGSPEYMQDMMNAYSYSRIEYSDNFHHSSTYLSYCCGRWDIDEIHMYESYTHIDPKMSKIMNQTKEMPLYDNMDLTIHITFNENAVSTYSPAMPLVPSSDMNVAVHETGKYSGKVEIIGLPDEYMNIVETIVNKTFPLYLQDMDFSPPSSGYNSNTIKFDHGNITVEETVPVQESNIKGTVEYGGEEVQMISLVPKSSYVMPSSSLQDVYYYYSPNKGFIVGFGMNTGVNKFETTPTTYEQAKSEISDIQGQDTSADSVNGSSGIPMTTIIIIAVVAIIAVIAGSGAYVWHRKKTKAHDMQMQAQPEQQYPPQYTEQQPVQPMQPEQPQDIQPEQGTEPQTQGDEEQFF